MQIELIYEKTCPNIDRARAALLAALSQSGREPRWQEWEQNDPLAPPVARRFGSPTILVEGRDVAGEPPSEELPSCRIYADEDGRVRGAPTVASITAALSPAGGGANARMHFASMLPAVGAALLPKLTCPACWPAYAALLSSLGIGFVDYTPWLMPATLLFLAVTLATLAWRPRRGFAPFLLGAVASNVVLAGKFAFDSELAVYTGVALLVVASLWNAWPLRKKLACPSCLKPGHPA